MKRLLLSFSLLLMLILPWRGMTGSPRIFQAADQDVRIGLNPNAASVVVRSQQPFTIDQNRTRSVKFTVIVSVEPNARTLVKADLQYRMLAELDEGKLLVFPMSARIRMKAEGAWLEFDNRSYRGTLEVLGNSRNTFTVVNELPMEEYLLGVVPNELNPRTFGQIEALKAQAVAARTYVVRNLGQYRREAFDICNTDVCQVYFGAGSEEPLATRAVNETRGVIATFENKPINAFYSSTCGGHTENSENIFDEKFPYLVSVNCEFSHPEPLPFSTKRVIPDWKDAVLAVAGVANFSELRQFLAVTGSGEPPTMQRAGLARWIRETFYPTLKPPSDEEFLSEQGILSAAQNLSARDILFRLIDRKSAFEWQQGVLQSWDGRTASIVVNGTPREFTIQPDAPIFQRVGEERLPMREGMWIGGELLDFRAVGDAIEMLVYRKNFVNAAADRFSRLAMWQVHKTKQELDAAVKPLNIGDLRDIEVLERGPSDRPVSTDFIGSTGRARVRALRFRSLLGLRDSLAYFDEERNSKGSLIGMTFYGQGWGHGVGMCQVGAYGMALGGATFEQILKKYYTGITLTRL